MCFGCSKEPSHWDGSFEYPQHMFWLRNTKIIFKYALLSGGGCSNCERSRRYKLHCMSSSVSLVFSDATTTCQTCVKSNDLLSLRMKYLGHRPTFLPNTKPLSSIMRPWFNKRCIRERSGSVVECLTRDRRAAGSSLTGVTALCPWARHIYPSLVLVQPRKTRPA